MLDKYIQRNIKPTGHSCKCDECGKEIEKGKERIMVLADVFNNYKQSYQSYHRVCFWRALLKIVKKPKGKLLKGFEMGLKFGKDV